MIRVALVRGKYLNNFEGQNYIFKQAVKLTGISSLYPIHRNFPFKTIKLPSPADIPYIDLPIKYFSNRTIGDSHLLVGLETLNKKFDIFHTADSHYYYSYQLAKMRARKKINFLISTSWETIPFNNESVKSKREIKKFSQKNTDLFICHTERARNCLIIEGIRANKTKIIRLGINLEKFKVQNPEAKLKKKKLTALFVGRPVEEKGINDLRAAYERSKNQNLELKIISNFPYEMMPSIYQDADIFIMPSKKTSTWEEQYGMVLIEAMASALPVVAYKSGSIPELLGDSGILINEGDVRGLSDALTRLTVNPDLRLKLGKMGRRRAQEEFDAVRTTKELVKTYNEAYNSITHKK